MILKTIKLTISTCFVLAALAGPAAAGRKPNIVFILADDLGYAELGSYGQKKIRTPHLDLLAKQGMSFTRNYCGNAVCAPSRCVLITGKHPGHAFIRNNGEVKPEGQRPIPDSEQTIAEGLRKRGYATGAFGKWGLGGPGTEGDPVYQGFDRFFGYNCQRHAHSYYPSYLWSNKVRVTLNNKPPVPGHASLPKGSDPKDPRSYDIFKGKDYAPDRINEQALKFIRANKDRPFFLYYPTVIPHVALHVPDEELKQYHELGWKDPPFTRAGGYGYTPHYTPRAAYAAMITRMDKYIGKILDLIDDLELTDDTIVIFTSDNGTTHLKQEVDYDFFQSVGKLRGLKAPSTRAGCGSRSSFAGPERSRPAAAPTSLPASRTGSRRCSSSPDTRAKRTRNSMGSASPRPCWEKSSLTAGSSTASSPAMAASRPSGWVNGRGSASAC